MTFPPASNLERILTVVIFFICAGLIAVGWFLTPDSRGFGTHSQLGFGECGLAATYGMPCPTCGMTTAFAYGVRFKIIDGFQTQPAGLLTALLAYAAELLLIVFFSARKNPFAFFTKKRVYIIAVIVLLIAAASWVYKIQTFRQ